MKDKKLIKYPVLINDIDDNYELPIVLAIVNQRNSSYLHVPLERLRPKSQNFKYQLIIKQSKKKNTKFRQINCYVR